MPTSMRQSICGSALFAALFMSVGCGNSVTSGVVTMKTGQNGAITITDKTGEKTLIVNEKKLPDNFPADIPIPDNATIRSSLVYTGGASVLYESPETNDALTQWYDREFPRHGWKKASDQLTGSSRSSMWAKERNTALLSIGEAPEGGRMQVSIIASQNGNE